MFRAKSKMLPDSIQKFFSIQDSPYNLRGVCMFTIQKAKKGMKRRCVSIVGVKFWNDANINLKTCHSFLVFKKMVCKAISEAYKYD